VPAEVRRDLLTAATERELSADEVLYVAGEEALVLYLVVEGRVRLVRERGGRPVFIHDEVAGGALGEVPLFEGTTYPATAIAAERSRVLAIPRDAVLSCVRRHPDLALAILARLAGRVRTLVDRLDRNSTQPTLARLAELVLARARSSGTTSFTLGASQQEVAEEIGTVREIVVRGLKSLREQGAIESRGGGRYVLVDAGVLERTASS
jgi:CRP/FNR family transcriptional regulator, dissimilatory nitrate respiration regulator